MVCPSATSEAEARWPRFGLVGYAVLTLIIASTKKQMVLSKVGVLRDSHNSSRRQGPDDWTHSNTIIKRALIYFEQTSQKI
jgi:hypothetical protein